MKHTAKEVRTEVKEEVKIVEHLEAPTGEILDPGYICFKIYVGPMPVPPATFIPANFRYADNTGLCDLTLAEDKRVPNKNFLLKSIKISTGTYYPDEQGVVNLLADASVQPKFKNMLIRAISDTVLQKCRLDGIINLPSRSK
jgi:hypothetical protein